ncbi:VWA domain-containing protein [Nakamurella sp. A5-74]|uniref:VWA domain-containing protein n=1 Tax=Nakamurella sp. A5-74 TaxID=3158264 RepID=A0AAU8DQ42_9ACTN
MSRVPASRRRPEAVVGTRRLLGALGTALTAAALVVAGPIPAGPVLADTGTQTPTPTTAPGAPSALPGAFTGRAPLMVILDASGSMKLEDAEGERIDQARRQLSGILSDLPDDATVGLLAYGTGTGPNVSERERGCRDVTELAPPAQFDQDALEAAAEEVIPSGYSPIGRAIGQAAAALPTDAPASILLVSDGFDLCTDPDPCASARDAIAANPALTVSVIGIQPDAAADTLFGCITSATGGTYLPLRYPDPTSTSTVDTAQASSSSASVSVARERLEAVLAAGYRREAEGLRPSGTPVVGTVTAQDAPVLVPGDYLDPGFTRGSYYADGAQKNGTVRYYALPQGEGMTPWASATAIGDLRSDEYRQLGLRLSLVNNDDDPCLPLVEATESGGEREPRPMVTAQVGGIVPGADGWSESCAVTEPLYLRVERLGEYRFGTATPVQLTIRSEPPLHATGRALSTSTELPPPTATTPSAISGGTNFATAPLLASGTTVADTIVGGETRFFAVRLGFGQRLAYRVTPIGQGTPVDRAASVAVQIRNPLATPVHTVTGGEGGPFVQRDEDSFLSGSTDVPVAAANRTSDDPEIVRYALPGTYFVLLSMAPAQDGPDATVPYTLTVQAIDATGTGGAAGYDPPATPTAGSSAATSAVPIAAGKSSGATGTPAWTWALGGLGVLTLGVAAAMLISRRRSSGSRRPAPGS